MSIRAFSNGFLFMSTRSDVKPAPWNGLEPYTGCGRRGVKHIAQNALGSALSNTRLVCQSDSLPGSACIFLSIDGYAGRRMNAQP
mmetsp:Transcript_24798/g.35722  ORF Transcript_24798/g.35722 Transcript_24798/m.35722 type:complete len:85 (+) Transcript_24798:149-403(+)